MKNQQYNLDAGQPTANSQQPTVNSQLSTANSQQPTANCQLFSKLQLHSPGIYRLTASPDKHSSAKNRKHEEHEESETRNPKSGAKSAPHPLRPNSYG